MSFPPLTQAVRRWRIGTVLAWLVLASLLPGMAGMGVLFTREYLTGRVRLAEDKIATARAMVQSVDSQLFRAQTVVQSLSASGLLVRHDMAGFHQRARESLAVTQAGMNIVLSDGTGQQLINTLRDFGEPLPHHGNPALLRQVFTTGQAAISGVYLGGVLRQPVVSIDMPVLEQGKVAYVLSIGVTPASFNGILTAQNFPAAWVSAVFDGEGNIVARTRSPEKFVGEKGTAEFIERILSAPEGAMDTVTREGIPTLSVWSRSPVTGWSVAIGIPRAQLEQELMHTLLALAGSMLGLSLLSLGFAWLAGRKIASSVHALRAPAIAMGRGLALPVPDTDIQESAEVAEAIHQAAGLLATRAAELADAHRIAGFGVWQYKVNTGELTVSDSVRLMCGREIPAFAEQRGSLLSVEAWEGVNAAIDQALKTGVGFERDVPVQHADGSTLWFHQKCETTRDSQGAVVELHGSLLDITRRRQAELSLEQSRQTYLQQLQQEVAERTSALVAANQALERMTRTDVLTGLQNRHAANERLRMEFLRLKRTGIAYAVLFLDIDHFKKVNDTYGHETGDQVLKHLARTLGRAVRETDFVARYGGEEFVVILTDVQADEALKLAEKVRHTVEDELFEVVQHLTISIGVALALGQDKNEEEAVHRADAALYRAKQEGRNRVRGAA